VPDRVEATRKAVLRALKLFCLGLVLQGNFGYYKKIPNFFLLARVTISSRSVCWLFMQVDFSMASTVSRLVLT
jgi:hypothetical protein